MAHFGLHGSHFGLGYHQAIEMSRQDQRQVVVSRDDLEAWRDDVVREANFNARSLIETEKARERIRRMEMETAAVSTAGTTTATSVTSTSLQPPVGVLSSLSTHISAPSPKNRSRYINHRFSQQMKLRPDHFQHSSLDEVEKKRAYLGPHTL